MSDKPNLANTNNEPSMEDILSSIRKVIAEDISNEETPEVSAEDAPADIATGTKEFPATDEATTFDETGDEAFTTDTLESVTPDGEDVLELDNILTELPDPHAMTGEQGEELELVTLDDDMVESDIDLEETGQVAVLGDIIPDINIDENTDKGRVEDAGEMDIATTAKANVFTPEDTNIATEPFKANDDINFDETLDLVMDSDASDYVTTNITAKEMEIEDWRDRTTDKAEDLGLSPNKDADLHAVVDEAVAETVAETLAEENLVEETLVEETASEAVTGEVTMAKETSEEPYEPATFEEPDPEPVVATPDEDMDLVKSLLDDLMDEPAPEGDAIVEEIVESADVESVDMDEAIEADFTNEILFGEDTDDSQDEQDMIIPEPDTALEPEADVQSKLAQIAKDIQEASATNTEIATNPDDVVTLERSDLVSKLALAGGAAVGAAAIATSSSDTEPENIAEQPAREPEPPEQDQQDPQPSLQEEDPMATPLKTDSLIDSETSEEAGNAFASLTTAVQEKALAEENGPPIGVLVKEALKPMLQEWLDANLKTMVQRAVTKEIKRISSGK